MMVPRLSFGKCNLFVVKCVNNETILIGGDEETKDCKLFREVLELNSNVGISLREDKKNVFVSLLLSIARSGHTFCCLPWRADSKTIQEYSSLAGLHYLVTDHRIETSSSLSLISQDDSFFLYKFTEGRPVNSRPLLYIFRTSGSTGVPKIVRVPEQCISSNIEKLAEKFRISTDDVILSCSPPTFDPFVVDVLLSMTTGAALLILNDFAASFHSIAKDLFNKEKKNSITILQITPSVFKTLSMGAMQYLFSTESSLRVICFGGEPFPEDLLETLRIDDSKEIFNIYGITEISSWSSLRRWQRGTRMDLGEPLDDEVFQMRESEEDATEAELWIGSRSRKCLIDDESEIPLGVLFRPTGDLVERVDGKYYFKGRVGDVIKRFGVKINLLDIARRVERSELQVNNVCCLFEQKLQKILLFYTGAQEIDDQIMAHLSCRSIELPDEIIFVPELPMTRHGKVSKMKLIEDYLKIKQKSKVLSELLQSFDLDRSFIANGGTSFVALQLLNQLESGDGYNYPNLIPLLLNGEMTLREVLKLVKSVPNNSSSIALQVTKNPLSVHWKYDLKKCIDASPTVFNHRELGNCVAVGSHSHRFVVLSLPAGHQLVEFPLPDRIESKILVLDDNLFLGCYDGCFYSFNWITKKINWKFDSRGMIKSEAIFAGDFIIFGNYSEGDNLFALIRDTGEKRWSRRIGNKGILSRAVVVNEELIGISTLDGTVAMIRTRTGDQMHTHKLKSPVFANPLLINDNHLLVSEVTGLVHCFSLHLTIVWSFKSEGNIFSSFAMDKGDSVGNCSIFFGCYDNCLYKLNLTSDGCELSWKCQLDSSIYSQPVIVGDKIVSCTTKGSVVVIKKKEGIAIDRFQMDGEIFSSPGIWEDKILFGCRDNFLYCLNGKDLSPT